MLPGEECVQEYGAWFVGMESSLLTNTIITLRLTPASTSVSTSTSVPDSRHCQQLQTLFSKEQALCNSI
jgi:hypothetical protein